MTSVDQHYTVPADAAELLGAIHTWRALFRQGAAHLAILAEHAPNHAARIAIEDAAGHQRKACALLASLITSLDVGAASPRREHSRVDLDNNARRTSPAAGHLAPSLGQAMSAATPTEDRSARDGWRRVNERNWP